MNEELLPCPFCGFSASLLVSVDQAITTYIAYDFKVQCNDCYAEGTSFKAPHNSNIVKAITDARAAWNKRVEQKLIT